MPLPLSPDKIETRHYINGAFSESSDKATFAVHSPFTQDKIADACEASTDDTNRAVAAAKAAFSSWSELSPDARGEYLKKLSALVSSEEHDDCCREANGYLGYVYEFLGLLTGLLSVIHSALGSESASGLYV